MNIPVRRRSANATFPLLALAGASVFDLYAADTGAIAPGVTAKIPLGFAFEIPAGHLMVITLRPAIAFKTALRQPNGFSVVDADYRGEVWMLLENVLLPCEDPEEARPVREMMTIDGQLVGWEVGQACEPGTHLIRSGDRVAQAFILPVTQVNLTESGEENRKGDGEREGDRTGGR